MMMRSLFRWLAVGLLASLAFATPSQAGYVVTAGGSISSSGSATASDFAFTFSDPVSGPFTIVSATGAFGGVTPTASGDVVAFNFASPSTSGSVIFTFTTSDPGITLVGYSPAGILNSSSLDTLGSSGGAQVTSVSEPSTTASPGIGVTSVPEPSTMALLGIGMTGFLVFHRFLRRTKVV